MRHYRIRRFESTFDSLSKIAVKLADKQVKKSATAENLFMQGTARGLQTLFLFQQGRYAKAIREGISALGTMERTLKKDRSFSDPKLVLGVYKYWKARTLDFGFGLQAGDLKLSKSMANDVWKNGRYLNVDAAFTLQNMFMKDETYERAWEMNEWLAARYPDHPSVIFHRAMLLEIFDKFDEALPLWEQLQTKLENFPVLSRGYLTEVHYHRAVIFERRMVREGNKESVEMNKAIEQALAHAEARNAKMEIESVYQKFGEVRKAALKLKKKYP